MINELWELNSLQICTFERCYTLSLESTLVKYNSSASEYLMQQNSSGGVLLLRRQHLQGQVLAQACQEEPGGLRVPQAHLILQENQASHQGLETGASPFSTLAD